MASIKELLQSMINKINGKNEGVDWNENDETSPAFVKNRPFYANMKFSQEIAIEGGPSSTLCKVSDNVPEQLSGIETCWLWIQSSGIAEQVQGHIVSLTENIFFVMGDRLYAVIATSDGASESVTGLNVGPLERGVYFIYFDDLYTSGISFTGADTPEITWDGDLGTLKTLDEKYIPKIPYKKLPYITETTPGIVDKNTFSEYAPIKVLYKYNKITGLASQIKSPFVFVDMDTGSSISSKCYFVYPQMQGIQIMPNTPNKEQSYVSAFSFDGYKCILVFYRTNTTIDRWYFESVKNRNEVILPSTTEGSTKQFRITVDDSGTISATEVT